jgi:sugar/nucleoside kinase (ribokinase family)
LSRAAEYDVVAMGEPLVQFSPLDSGPLSQAGIFDKHAAGAESNVLIGLSRLGHRTALISKVGNDELSRFVLSTLRGEGVDTRWVKRVAGKNVGVYVTQRNYPVLGKNDVIYYRGESAASTISVADVPEDAIRQSRVFHLSGITPALSASCRRASHHASRLAKKYGVIFSFDPNYRRKLWPVASAKPVFKSMAGLSDLLFLDVEEASIILGGRQAGHRPEATLRALSKLGPETVVLKLGAQGGLTALATGKYFHVPSFKVPVVDAIGAGDAVVSGFLSGLLRDKDTRTCLKWAAASSALVVTRRGDFENLPTPTDLQNFLAAKEAKTEFDPR